MKRINIATIGVSAGILIVIASIAYIAYTSFSLNSRVAYAYEDAYQENYSNSSFNGYQSGYQGQYQVGYDAGYQDGVEDGHKRGYDEAYLTGTEEGRRQGYDTEYAIAIEVGRENGYEAGYESGIEAGQDDGQSSKVRLHEPSYMEVIDFLRRDETNLEPYLEDEYICTDFAADVNNNAEAEGIRCYLVLLAYKDNNMGHAIVAFNTTDASAVFVEPQTDEIIDPHLNYNIEEILGIW